MNPIILDILSITWPLIIVFILFSYWSIKEYYHHYKQLIKELDND